MSPRRAARAHESCDTGAAVELGVCSTHVLYFSHVRVRFKVHRVWCADSSVSESTIMLFFSVLSQFHAKGLLVVVPERSSARRQRGDTDIDGRMAACRTAVLAPVAPGSQESETRQRVKPEINFYSVV